MESRTCPRRTRSSDADRLYTLIPQTSVNKFLQYVEERAWTDAEKELDTIRQKSENNQWSRGYVKALEGLLLTYRNDDDKYIYLPRALANGPEEVEALGREFSEFSANELHGEYDRGYFRALEDYLALRRSLKTAQPTLSATAVEPVVVSKSGMGEKNGVQENDTEH